VVSLIPAEGGTGLKAEICTQGNLPSRRDSGNLISDIRIPEGKSLGIPRLCLGSQANHENEGFSDQLPLTAIGAIHGTQLIRRASSEAMRRQNRPRKPPLSKGRPSGIDDMEPITQSVDEVCLTALEKPAVQERSDVPRLGLCRR
jgi:hypothetical protein